MTEQRCIDCGSSKCEKLTDDDKQCCIDILPEDNTSQCKGCTERISRLKDDSLKKIEPKFEMRGKNRLYWDLGVSNNQEPYGFCVYEFSNLWATLMEKSLEEGNKLKDVWYDLSMHADKKYGITGAMFSFSISVLRDWWVHGKELAELHKSQYN